MSSPRKGDVAPDFLFRNDGRTRSLNELRGTLVIVTLRRAAQSGPQPVLQELQLEGGPVLVLSSGDDTVAERYGVRGDSALFLIGVSGHVVWSSLENGSTASEPLM